jgi:hypothetical protein
LPSFSGSLARCGLKTHTNDRTRSLNGNGRLVSQDTRTGPNGKSVSSTTTRGRYRNRTTATGPNGGARTFSQPR